MSDLDVRADENVDFWLLSLGWDYGDLRERLGVHRNTVMKWRSNGYPKYAVAYLQLAFNVKLLSRVVE